MPKKILVIDDSRMVHMVVTKILKVLDVEVSTAVNGQEGIEKAEREHPDLILLDATMPVLDGIETLAALKGNPVVSGIPVVMLNAEPNEQEIQRALQLGAIQCMAKPFTGDALVACLSPYVNLGQKAA
jgi:CheY-like chemotaxis protein